MSTIVLYPANGYDFDAADVAAYNAPRTSGVYSSDEDFVVAAAGGMDVTVSAGLGWVRPERFAGYSIVKREADTLTLPLADGTRPRIDRIVLRYDAASRKASLQVLTGDPASTHTAPAISRTALVYDLCLAEITRPAGSTSITAANITDTRLDESLCGVMSDGVTGIPTDALLKQWQAAQAQQEADARQSTADLLAESRTSTEQLQQELQGKANQQLQTLDETISADVKQWQSTVDAHVEDWQAKADKLDEETKKLLDNTPCTLADVQALLAAQREEDYAKIRFWASNDPTSPAAIIGGTWERITGKFIMGASDDYPVGTTGGSATHTLTVDEMPSHSHSGSTGSAGGHSHSGTTASAGAHTHTVNSGYDYDGSGGSNFETSISKYSTVSTSSAGAHTHTFSTNSAGSHTHTVSIGSTGGGKAADILNPYHALYVWVRVDDDAA